MTSCILCSRNTRNRKKYKISKTGRVGVICNYCKQAGRIEMNHCEPIK